MVRLTLQVLDGRDKGQVFPDLEPPVMIGREEGNSVRLNDERISRYHVKIQQDGDDVILTDLESTNGTKVNGNFAQIARLRPGDCITVGRSVLLFGSNSAIAEQIGLFAESGSIGDSSDSAFDGYATDPQAGRDSSPVDLEPPGELTNKNPFAEMLGENELPPLPAEMSLSQTARLAEIFQMLHRGLSRAVASHRAGDEDDVVLIDQNDWQNVVAAQMLLARYIRAVSEPKEQ